MAEIEENGVMPEAQGFDCTPDKSYAVPILISLITSIGIIGNSIVIFLVTVLKEYEKSVTNIYILQLAIADFIFLFQLFFHARSMLLGQWTYGVAWCKMSEAIKMLNYYSSIMFLTVMSVDRYMAINLAMNQKVRRFRTKRAACIVSTAVWTLAILSVINILIYADVHECDCQIYFPHERPDYFNEIFQDFLGNDSWSSNENNRSDYGSGYSSEYADPFLDLKDDDRACSFDQPQFSHYYKTWISCNFILAFVIPLFVICFSYALIIRRIMKPMAIGSKSQKSNNTRKRVTRMVTGLVSAFVVCWLPYHSFNLARLNGIRLKADACISVTDFTLVLAYSNSSVNPFFYTFLATNFRKRWGSAVGIARKGLRQSILSHSGEYTPGASTRGRRKSSATNSTAKNRDDISVNSFVTKNTIVPTGNLIIKEEKL